MAGNQAHTRKVNVKSRKVNVKSRNVHNLKNIYLCMYVCIYAYFFLYVFIIVYFRSRVCTYLPLLRFAPIAS